MPQVVRIAGVQMDVLLAEPAKNLARMVEFLESTRRNDAVLTVFPECALTGYCFDSKAEAWPFAEQIPGPSTAQMAQACKRLSAYVAFGMLEADGDRLFNACVLVGPDGLIGSYRKVHLPYLGIDMYTTPGDRPFAVHSAGPVRVGMNICYDGAFPEAARAMALAGADLIILPTNWPPGSECTADFVINARALENNVYYAAVNRIGTERGFNFIGKSKICDTYGRVITEAQHEDEIVFYADIDLDRARNKHLIRVPEKHEIHRFADRRPDLYGPIVAPVNVKFRR